MAGRQDNAFFAEQTIAGLMLAIRGRDQSSFGGRWCAPAGLIGACGSKVPEREFGPFRQWLVMSYGHDASCHNIRVNFKDIAVSDRFLQGGGWTGAIRLLTLLASAGEITLYELGPRYRPFLGSGKRIHVIHGSVSTKSA